VGSGTLYSQLLLFPERAEYLNHANYSAYRMQLDHWRDLSSIFRRAFQAVYERQSASVLLVHGDQGTGKTAFSRKLAADFELSGKGVRSPDRDNLWHVLTGGDPLDLQTIQEATRTTDVTVITPKAGWLAETSTAARAGKQKMRVFVIDDFHKDAFLSEWAGLTRPEYLQLKAAARPALLESVAQRIVEDCRGDFARSLFVLLSADDTIIDELKVHLDRSHRGLAQTLQLPLPEKEAKEQIVRTNINRLNQRSYWYCLDQGGPEEKRQAYEMLSGDGGFIDSFRAIDRALSSGDGDKRAGRRTRT
jgi:SpoVK/Ycf46/Vps4 family AAA+-type ATPase